MNKPYYDLNIDRKTDKITKKYLRADLEEVVLDCKQKDAPKELPSSFMDKHGWKVYAAVSCASMFAGRYMLNNQEHPIFTESTPGKYIVVAAGVALLGVIGGTAGLILSYIHQESGSNSEEEGERNRFK